MYSELRDQWYHAFILEMMRHYEFEHIDNPFATEEGLFKDFFDRELPQSWLVRNKGRHYEMIRIQMVDEFLPSAMARDIRRFADRVPRFRKKLKAKTIRTLTIYILPFPADQRISQMMTDMAQLDDRNSHIELQGIYIDDLWQPSAEGLQLMTFNIETEDLQRRIQSVIETYDKFEIKQRIKYEQRKKEQAFFQVFHYGKPIFTYILLFVNMMIFFFLESVGSSTDLETLIEYGAKSNVDIQEGEYWRLFTPMFLHIGWIHLAFNSLALYFLGMAVERIYGSSRFIWMYLFAGFAGILASFAFTPNISAGASGAIFGCFGALLYFGMRKPSLFFRTMGMDVIFILVFNLMIGFLIPMIDNFGHIGGLIGGFVGAAIFGLPKEKRKTERLIALIIAAIAVVVVFWLGMSMEWERLPIE